MTGLILESFDSAAEPEQPIPSADAGYEAGFEAGQQAAIEAAEARQSAAVEQAAQRLCDLEFTFAEVSQDMLEALAPLFRAIVETLLPSLAQGSLVIQIDELLCELAADEMSQICLRISAADYETLNPVLAERYQGITLGSDESLEPGQVTLSSSGADRMIDLARAERAVEAALGALIHETERMKANG